MPDQFTLPLAPAEIEASLLGALLNAESAREGAAALLDVIRPLAEETAVAIAARGRDGLSLHVLAEAGPPRHWPATLEPQFALGAQPGVDPGTSAMIIPLRAHGRVVGALLFGDTAVAGELLHEGQFTPVFDTTAAVLHALVSRTDDELRRRAYDLRSVQTILEGMAHQMANALTGASAITQLLVDEIQDESQKASVRQVQHELTRAFAVLRDLLEFQRDTNAQDGTLDLNAVAERMVRFRGYAIREQGITLELETLPGFMGVRADARGLEHAVLIALRFAELKSHGTINRSIVVRVVERGPKEVAIEITDSGTGDIPELTTSFFDIPFRAEHPSRHRSDDQPDLGLVDGILRGCGGSLRVTGSKTDGTTLALLLPRANTPISSSQSRIQA